MRAGAHRRPSVRLCSFKLGVQRHAICSLSSSDWVVEVRYIVFGVSSLDTDGAAGRPIARDAL